MDHAVFYLGELSLYIIMHKLSCIVRRPVVHQKPVEVLASLAAKALVEAGEGVGPVVCGGKNSQLVHYQKTNHMNIEKAEYASSTSPVNLS